MEWEFIAPLVMTITLILTTGTVLLLRPVTKRLGDLIETTVKQKRGELPAAEMGQVRDVLETMNQRLALIEDRQDFTDALIASRQPQVESGRPKATNLIPE